MTSIIYVGMDVHTTNYTLCCYSVADDRIFAGVQVEPDYHEILKYLARVENREAKGASSYVGTKPVAWDILCTTSFAAMGSTASSWLPRP